MDRGYQNAEDLYLLARLNGRRHMRVYDPDKRVS